MEKISPWLDLFLIIRFSFGEVWISQQTIISEMIMFSKTVFINSMIAQRIKEVNGYIENVKNKQINAIEPISNFDYNSKRFNKSED